MFLLRLFKAINGILVFVAGNCGLGKYFHAGRDEVATPPNRVGRQTER